MHTALRLQSTKPTQTATLTVTSVSLELVCSELLLEGTTRGLLPTLYRNGREGGTHKTHIPSASALNPEVRIAALDYHSSSKARVAYTVSHPVSAVRAFIPAGCFISLHSLQLTFSVLFAFRVGVARCRAAHVELVERVCSKAERFSTGISTVIPSLLITMFCTEGC